MRGFTPMAVISLLGILARSTGEDCLLLEFLPVFPIPNTGNNAPETGTMFQPVDVNVLLKSDSWLNDFANKDNLSICYSIDGGLQNCNSIPRIDHLRQSSDSAGEPSTHSLDVYVLNETSQKRVCGTTKGFTLSPDHWSGCDSQCPGQLGVSKHYNFKKIAPPTLAAVPAPGATTTTSIWPSEDHFGRPLPPTQLNPLGLALYVGTYPRCLKRNFINVGITPLETADGSMVSEPGSLYSLTSESFTAVPSSSSSTAPPFAPSFLYLHADVTQRMAALPEDSVDAILSEHFIEHVDFNAAVRFFAEARRVLKHNGGVLRVSTPDFALFARAYVDKYGGGGDGDATSWSSESGSCGRSSRSSRASVDNGARRGKAFFEKQWDASAKTFGLGQLHQHMDSPEHAMDLVNRVFYSYEHRYIFDFHQLKRAAKLGGWTADDDNDGGDVNDDAVGQRPSQKSKCAIRQASFRRSSGEGPAVPFLATELAQSDSPRHMTESLYIEMWCTESQ